MGSEFVGRKAELALLRKRLNRVSTAGQGEALAIRGRRQVGKSRLVQEFCDQAGVPYVFWAASKGAAPATSVQEFVAELATSNLADHPSRIPEVRAGSWPDAFKALATAMPHRPSIVVLDEVPWLSEQDAGFDGALQTAWDRLLSRKPVFLILLGSDLHMMERMTAYDRPFYGRAGNFRLNPLNPAEVGDSLGLAGEAALDAYLVSGGLPGILRAWPDRMPALDFIEQECTDPASELFNVPAAALLAEFPSPDNTRRVLESIGGGDRTHANIAAAAGNHKGAMPSGALSPILKRLVNEKQVVAGDAPLSTRPGHTTLYRVSDSNLRLYLASLRRVHEEIMRGRSGRAFQLVRKHWTSWRGRAMEPVIRQALELAALDGKLPWNKVESVGGWWNRRFDPEIDVVGADRSPIARQVYFAGSIKWIGSPFDGHDLSDLIKGAAQIPGFRAGSTGLMVVSLSGVDERSDLSGVDVVWGPDEVLAAWLRWAELPLSVSGFRAAPVPRVQRRPLDLFRWAPGSRVRQARHGGVGDGTGRSR